MRKEGGGGGGVHVWERGEVWVDVVWLFVVWLFVVWLFDHILVHALTPLETSLVVSDEI